MTITAKYASRCGKCRLIINAGERVEWTPGTKAVHVACPEFGESAAAYEGPRLSVEDAGVYVLPDGTIIKMQANRDKTAIYPKLWVEISGERLAEDDSRPHGEYRYIEDWTERRTLREQVEANGHKMTLEEAQAFILRYGICARCGRALKDATSVLRGIGPVCIKFFSSETTGADLMVSAA